MNLLKKILKRKPKPEPKPINKDNNWGRDNLPKNK